MVIWMVLGVVLLVLILSTIVIIIERKSIDRGIIVSSNYRKLIAVGIIIALASIVGMAVLFVLKKPFFIVAPVLGMGIVYMVAGLVYRKEWVRWVQSQNDSEMRSSEFERKYSELKRKIDDFMRR